ncbi:DUF6118 family protein [Sphingomonas paucimobilis]|jgi:hypothetical protein|uniref:DUF6118 family protein n=2 Tax=Sphingomonas TaxID=13687 RepID=UPI00035360FF|nr:DUF6118 family protein [Sphingomonas paucimobilis]EPE61697.1 hypothetical protein L479_01910 [Exiguobacterium sp. S17]MCM3681366.1 DUF6118 family protein [Sphingomonas paucimobilis]MDG5973572.1 hypothetical protein [Sphingomonas paucimobilis]
MTDEAEYDGSDAAAEALAEVRAEVTLLRRAIEGLTAERGAIDTPDYTETLGRMQQGIDATADRIAHINDVIARSAALAITPEQMAQRIAAAGNAARREDQAALAKAGEDKARVMAELRAIAGSAWTRADQRNRQLWFALGGVAAGILAWAIVPGLVAREIAPASWQWPERMAARTLDLPRWEAGQRMMQSADPAAFRTIVAADRIMTANRETMEGCSKAAARARETVRCMIRIRPYGQDSR